MQPVADVPESPTREQPLALRADAQLAPFASRVAGQECLLICGGRHYAASARLPELFELVRAHPAPSILCAELNRRWRTSLSPEQTRALVAQHLGPFLAPAAGASPAQEAPRRRARADFLLAFPIVSERIVAALARPLGALYAPALGVPLSLLAAALLVDAWRRTSFAAPLDAAYLGWGLALSLAITLLHELGHAAAYMRWFRRAGAIYFALLVVLPVMYVRVDESWRGEPRRRLGVDLGGVYFQWLAFIPLCGAGYLAQYPAALFEAGLLINGLLLLCNLNPILKFDGYWVLSSLLGVPNLAQNAGRLLADRLLRRAPSVRVPRAVGRALLVYAGLRWSLAIASVCLLVLNLPALAGYAGTSARTCATGLQRLGALGWSTPTLIVTLLSAFKVAALAGGLALLARLALRTTQGVLLRAVAARSRQS